MNSRTVLRIAAPVEAVSIVLLFANLLTVHWPAVASALGPIHGTAYLVTVVTALSAREAATRAKWLSLVPAVGGYLALRYLDTERVGADRRVGER